MLNENAKKWIAALRSGEYKQAKKHLRTEEGFCCLGVLCDIYAKEGLGQWNEDFGRDDNSPPELVLEWVGLKNCEGRYHRNDETTTYLTVDNDSRGKTFSEIADIIELEPEGLFVK